MKCTWEECEREVDYRGFCSMHYKRARKQGIIQKIPRGGTCKVDGCEKKVISNGYCNRHDMQIRTFGKTFGNPSRTKNDPNEITIDGDIAKIQMYDKRGNETKQAIVDKNDIPVVSEYKWRWGPHDNRVYGANKTTTTMSLPRLIMGCHDKSLVVDHINFNTLDNRQSNLRICRQRDNARNSRKLKDGFSTFKGVKKSCGGDRFAARIKVNYQEQYLGVFDTEVEAALAYNEAAKEHFGEFAYLNEV